MSHHHGGVSVEDLLLPDTPKPIRELYLGFEAEAKTRTFGLLEEDLIVLDTETTGLSFKNCELIEIAAARISGRSVVDRFQTYVRPTTPIPPEIVALTGIQQVDVADAPSCKQAIAELAEFVGGMPILAHNATFDRTFIQKAPGGHEVSDTWVDTLSLSRIALPRLSSHRLVDLAEAFGCAPVSHRAMDDVDALCGVWRIILCGLAALPPGTLAAIGDMHEDVDWSFRPIISHLALESAGSEFHLDHIRRELVRGLDDVQHEDACERVRPLDVPSAEQIDTEFSPGGTVSRMYNTFERRDEQVQMAQAVTKAFSTSTNLAVEAGTGVGKSISYLLPEALLAQANNITMGVATKTNALTDQLISHELPALAKALPGGLTYFSLKGYEHYPCLRRVQHSMASELPLDQVAGRKQSKRTIASDMLTAIAVTIAFACQSPTGDLDALGIRWNNVPREMLTTTPEQCTHTKCPFFPDACLVHGARRRAGCADIVVTNHSLLLRNVEADGKILPPIRHWVVDEAHSFEDEARRQWATEMSAEASRATFEQLGGAKTGAIHTLLGQVASSEASTLLMGLLTKASTATSRASVACADLFDEIRGLSALGRGAGGYDTQTIWIGDEVRQTPEWARVAETGVAAIDALEAAYKALSEANVAIAEAIEKPSTDLADATRRLYNLLAATKLIIAGEDTSYVYSAQLVRGRAGVGRERLVAEKLDIGSELAERWLPEMMSVVFTSATMAVGEDFSHFNHAVGLDKLDSSTHCTLQLDSSFDFNRNMGVVVSGTMPQPNDPRYLAELEKLLYDVHVCMGGSVLTLFTNRREMERVYEGIQPKLAAQGLDLIIQERGAGARTIRDKFLATQSSSLFALRSFWEGFDAGGDTLRCVVIPKLPFASPNDPISQERDRREERAWWRYSLPDAVLSVKQAAGRLIRTSSDSGVLVLCDSRLVSKSYGRAFISSLPSRNVQTIGADQVGDYIRIWRKTHED